MTISYSSNEGIVQAVKKTFDGDHPCRLCAVIQDELRHETKEPVKPASSPEFKFGKMLKDLSLPEIAAMPPIVWHEVFLEGERNPKCSIGIPAFAPSVPPPRLA